VSVYIIFCVFKLYFNRRNTKLIPMKFQLRLGVMPSQGSILAFDLNNHTHFQQFSGLLWPNGHDIRQGIRRSKFKARHLQATFNPGLQKTTNIPGHSVSFMIKFARRTFTKFAKCQCFQVQNVLCVDICKLTITLMKSKRGNF